MTKIWPRYDQDDQNDQDEEDYEDGDPNDGDGHLEHKWYEEEWKKDDTGPDKSDIEVQLKIWLLLLRYHDHQVCV